MEGNKAISELTAGAFFDDSLPLEEPTRDRVYRVLGVRTRTVLAENALGIRRSFSSSHSVRPTEQAFFDDLKSAKSAAPAKPVSEVTDEKRSGVA